MQEFNIKAEADKRGVSVEFDKRNGKITLKGHESDVNEVYMKAKELLFTARKEKEDDEKAKMLAEFVSLLVFISIVERVHIVFDPIL